VGRGIDPKTLLQELEAGRPLVVLDVRSGEEFRDSHVPGAVHFPFTHARDRAIDVPARPADQIVVYCGHGPRAWIAGAALRRRGYANIVYLKGHMRAWRKLGLRVQRGVRL
jgi:rhodanese-related sulfurtransferase